LTKISSTKALIVLDKTMLEKKLKLALNLPMGRVKVKAHVE